MTPKEKARELVGKYAQQYPTTIDFNGRNIYLEYAKQCSIICVDEILRANPHSNPLNTDVYSTMSWWYEVKTEIEKL